MTAKRSNAWRKPSGGGDKMPRYQVEELCGEEVVSAQTVDVDEPIKAAEHVAGAPISPRALQEHWFRVVDEEENSVFEFSLAEPVARDFSK
ncbi:hypothetical protein LB523_19320 [Mesorhizobium sp. ESP-6-4]|uniref:hypothetical protein n=1 Tax=Mesorhizobium sp. ESP-6-4 TaxID=2876624 RepID=UPI001CCA7611|nr:hypothetical protein [Mesorhizobium sp. ESP-6-4]MBZ9661197.1 hypothetical protein [Mesorhizobium sp. ESP-6-4]